MKQFINLLGGNAIGKSTRVAYLTKYLDEKCEPYEPLIHYSMKKKKDIEVGRIYNTTKGKIFIGGRMNGKGKWTGLDTADFSTGQSRYDFIKFMFETHDIDIFVQEGFFNNRIHTNTLEKLHEHSYPVDSCVQFAFLYDDVTEYMNRCNDRTGKDRGLDWAENSSGWKENVAMDKKFKLISETSKGETIRCNKDERKDFLVDYIFNDSFEVSE